MKIYITYFSYDNDEYEIWNLSGIREKSIKNFKEEHIPFLILGKHPDISRLYLVEVDMTRSGLKWLESKPTGEELKEFFRDLEDFNTDCEYIYETDGTINLDLVEYYFQSCNDPEDDVDFDEYEWMMKLDELEQTNPEEYKKLVKEFVEQYF
jgi:hypothetical protein